MLQLIIVWLHYLCCRTVAAGLNVATDLVGCLVLQLMILRLQLISDFLEQLPEDDNGEKHQLGNTDEKRTAVYIHTGLR